MKKFLSSCVIFIGLNCLAIAHAATAQSGPYFNVSAVSGQLTVSSNIAEWGYQKAGIKVTNPSYALSGVGSECTMASNGYCLFRVNSTQPATLSFTGPAPGNIEVSLCLNGSNAYSCQNYAASFAKINYAYISNLNAQTPERSIVRCEVSSLDGSLSACLPVGVSTLDRMSFLAMNPSGNVLYAIMYVPLSGYFIQECELNSLGIASCSTASSTLSAIAGASINPAGNKYYYTLSDISSGSYTVNTCDIDHSGALVNCGILAADFSTSVTGLRNISFNPDGSLAYVVYENFSSINAKVCGVKPDGTLDTTSCIDAVSPFANPFDSGFYGIAIDPSNQYAYATDNNTLYTCNIDSADGSFSACTANSQFFGALNTVTLNPAGSLAYLPEGSSNEVSACQINSTTGLLDTCQASGSGLDGPFSLVLSP